MAKSYLDKDGLLYFLQKIRPNAAPPMDGTASTGSAKRFALQDHVHPTDTTRAPLASPALTGTPTAPTATTGTSSTQIATTAFVANSIGAMTSGVSDVKIDNTSIVTDGIANIPTASASAKGLMTSAHYSKLENLTGEDIPAESTSATTIAETFAAMENEFATALDDKVDKVEGKGLSTNDYTTTEKNKLSGIASGAEVNQNAFSNVKVGSTTVAADAKTDTLELVAGTNISLTPDATNDKVTIGFSGTIPTVPNNFGTVKVGSTNITADTTSDTLTLAAGSNITLTPDASNDKVTIAATDTTYSDFTAPTSSAAGTHGLVPAPAASALPAFNLLSADGDFRAVSVKPKQDVNGNLQIEFKVGSSGVTENVPAATTSANGAMSSDDKTKLNGIASGAEVNQNAFSNVKVGSTTVAADSKTDTLELVAGSNITLTPDATNDKVTIAFGGTIPTIPNNFGTVKVGSTNVVADTTSDTLELVAGDCITLTPDATNDKVTIKANAFFAAGASTMSALTSLDGTSYDLMKWSARGAASGVCPLNASSKIDSSYLPSYVDDVVEAYPRSGQTELSQNWLATGSASGTVISPETGKIYILMADSTSYATNTQFRWGGTAYVKLADGGVSSITNAEIDTIVAT